MPANSEIFKRFPNKVFVETGTFHGQGVEDAMRAGFRRILSIELCPSFAEENQKRFAGKECVTIIQGDSGCSLGEHIKDILTPITFWLDGHYSGGETARGPKRTPILDELRHIKEHPIKSHSILIDDVRIFGTEEFDNISLGSVIEALLQINPGYHIRRIDGAWSDGAPCKYDILVATPN